MINKNFELEDLDLSSTELIPWSHQWFQLHRKKLGDHACEQLGIYEIPEDVLLSVVVPVFNESATLSQLVQRVIAVPIRKEIILIDDGSSDDSVKIAYDLIEEHADHWNQFRLLKHSVNQGKGASIKTGFAAASGDIVIIQDADLEYNPQEYPALIRPIVQGAADVVYGSRFSDRTRIARYWHYQGNKFLTIASNWFTNLNLTDMETCYKVFSRKVIDQLTPTLEQKRFGIEPEMTAKIARWNYRIHELPISYSGRSYAEGKKINWKDGVQAIWCIVRYGLLGRLSGKSKN